MAAPALVQYGCVRNADCGHGGFCLLVYDWNCEPSEHCSWGQCFNEWQGCRADCECPEGYFCFMGVCQDPNMFDVRGDGGSGPGDGEPGESFEILHGPDEITEIDTLEGREQIHLGRTGCMCNVTPTENVGGSGLFMLLAVMAAWIMRKGR